MGIESKIFNLVYEIGDYLGVKYEIFFKSKKIFVCICGCYVVILEYSFLNFSLVCLCFSYLFRKFMDGNEFFCIYGEELKMIK